MLTVAEAQASQTIPARPTIPRWAYSFVVLAIFIAAVAVYSPVFFNAFTADDLMHVTWLHQAAQHPEMLFRNFDHPWLDVQSAKFYRPLISITLFSDYLLWGDNATGYHVTNALYHAACSVFIFLFLSELTWRLQTDAKTQLIFAGSAAALFALYPAHTEAVSWITARVDTVMAAFFALSLWCYMRWRNTSHRGFLFASVTGAALSFCSKEMALAIPPTLAALEFFCLQTESNVFRKAFYALRETAWFWAVTAVYFAVRAHALGTFIGGYDDRLGLAVPLATQLQSWGQGFKMLVFPMNAELVTPTFWAARAWTICVGIAAVAMVAALVRSWSRRVLWFLCAFAVFALAPVYKLFSISPVMEASRFAYLISIPICCVIPLGLSALGEWNKRLQPLVLVLSCILCIASCNVLLKNNRAWVKAGRQANAVAACTSLVRREAATHPCVLFNVPDAIHGAYVTRGAFMGIFGGTAYPIVSVADNEPISLIKQQIGNTHGRAPSVFYWDSKAQTFQKCLIERQTANSDNATISGIKGASVSGDGKNLSVSEFCGEAQLSPPNTWNADFLEVHLTPVSADPSHRYIGFRFANSLTKAEMWEPIKTINGQQVALFNLHQRPDWFLSNRLQDCRLLLPAKAQYELHGIRFSSAAQSTPTLTIQPALGSVIDIAPNTRQATLIGASDEHNQTRALRLTVLKPLSSFEQENRPSSDTSNVFFTKIIQGNKGQFELTWRDFGGAAFHRARVEALDAGHNPVGLPSDSILFHALPR